MVLAIALEADGRFDQCSNVRNLVVALRWSPLVWSMLFFGVKLKGAIGVAVQEFFYGWMMEGCLWVVDGARIQMRLKRGKASTDAAIPR